MAGSGAESDLGRLMLNIFALEVPAHEYSVIVEHIDCRYKAHREPRTLWGALTCKLFQSFRDGFYVAGDIPVLSPHEPDFSGIIEMTAGLRGKLPERLCQSPHISWKTGRIRQGRVEQQFQDQPRGASAQSLNGIILPRQGCSGSFLNCRACGARDDDLLRVHEAGHMDAVRGEKAHTFHGLGALLADQLCHSFPPQALEPADIRLIFFLRQDNGKPVIVLGRVQRGRLHETVVGGNFLP